MSKKKKISPQAKLGLGLGLTAAVAAGIYFLSGEKGKKNREVIKDWVSDLKAEVLNELRKLEDVKKEDYFKIIEKVIEGCSCKNKKEISEVAKDLKNCWSGIEKEVKSVKKKISKPGKKIKVVKK